MLREEIKNLALRIATKCLNRGSYEEMKDTRLSPFISDVYELTSFFSKPENCFIKIKRIHILLTNATDKVMIFTELSCPFPKEAIPSQQPLILEFETGYDMAIDYVKRNFPNHILETVNLRN